MRILVVVSAVSEWKVVQRYYPVAVMGQTPFGQYFVTRIITEEVIFLQGGWGKISAAASTQYALSRWQPDLVINLGTCGGFGNGIQRGDIILVEETLVYDIIERMGDADQALDEYRVRIDLSWLREPLPITVKKTRLISADQDIDPKKIAELQTRFQAVVADWESGAIAWVAQRNKIGCLILRGVSDLVTPDGGEAYGDWGTFLDGAQMVMRDLLNNLSLIIENIRNQRNQV